MSQFLQFCVIGCLNTAIDFGLFHALTRQRGGLAARVLSANVVSTSVAMTFSFLANSWFVFDAAAGALIERFLPFLVVTCTSSYCIQSGILWACLKFETSVRAGVQLAGAQAPAAPLGYKFRAKALAVIGGLLWNFLGYKYLVFT